MKNKYRQTGKNKSLSPKSKWLTLCAMMLAFGLASCVDYSDEATTVSAKVRLTLPEEFTSNSGLEGRTVVLMAQNGSRLTSTTDAEGVASFSNIVPDVYTVSASWELTQAEYAAATGDNVVNEGAVVSGNLNNRLVKGEETIALPTVLAINRSLVIGKIYYAGSKDANKKNYLAGQFIELYNQSDKAINVAGLYIGLLESNATPAYTLDNLHEKFSDSVVVCKQVFRIPADKAHALKPGESLVITNSAIDHTAKVATERNLLSADYEAKFPTGRIVNNPSTPALEQKFSSFDKIPNMNLLQSGPCGVVIFRTEKDVTKFDKVYSYGKTKGSLWLTVPKRYVIDGVDILKYNSKSGGADVATKHLYNDIDGGYATISAVNGYNGEVVYRKTSTRKGKDGHRILQDTNNSLNDFKLSTTINIREYDE